MDGPPESPANLFRRIRRCFKFRRQRIYVLDDPADLLPVSPKVPVRICEVNRDNVVAVSAFRGETVAQSFRGMLEQGQVGVNAVADSQVIGHAWAIVRTTRCQLANGYLRLRDRQALVHFCNVREDYRGNLIYPAMVVDLTKRLFDCMHMSRVMIDTEVRNEAAIRGIQRTGFRPIGRALFVQFRGRRILRLPLFW